jgi:protein-S-isoprenylcysteine O-methyltransferase Ste14
VKLPAPKDVAFVSTQLVLFVLYLIPLFHFSFQMPMFFKILAFIIAVVGLLVIGVAILQLNKNLTPFPSPKENSELIQTGLYQFVRHPIYSGIILTTLGFGFYQGSTWKICIGIALWLLFFFKSQYEETLLVQKFPEYLNYRKRTRRFF